MNKVPLTLKGAEALKAELTELKSVVRPRIIQAIAEAREHGDLKENAEYHAAKEQQGFTEGRISEIEGKLGNAQIIDVTEMNANGKIIFGTTVGLVDENTGNDVKYQIVGDDEADIKSGKLSISAPIARALIGKEEGDFIEVQTPGGLKEFEIVSVQYI